MNRQSFQLILALWLLSAGPSNVLAQEVDFATQIRPLLSDRCYACHGPDETARTSGTRLDTEDGLTAFVTPGQPEESPLIERIFSSDESEMMPPPESLLALEDHEKELIRQWVEQGARWKAHWAFVPPIKPDPPAVGDDWASNEIDRFILAQMQKQGLLPSDRTTRDKLIRRLTFDITGLPPTPDEIDAFLADETADAYEKLVDGLLERSKYGERMASEWLDVARYSDSYGMQIDQDRFVWPWRDWVIDAFNRNLPYDEFIIEQLAGDLLPEPTAEQLLATTFNRLHSQAAEGGNIPEEFRVEYVADRAHTVATAFMGLTLECARCHDHKFDPISQEEYYRLFAYFNNIDEAGLYPVFTESIPTPTLLLYDDDAQREDHKLRQEHVDTARTELDEARQLAIGEPGERWVKELADGFDKDSLASTLRSHLVHYANLNELELGDNQPITDYGAPVAKLTGDDEIKLNVGNFRRTEPFSASVWLHVPEHKERAVVFHRSRAWTDAGSRGYELLLVDGRLQFSLVHFLPGNAATIRAADPLPLNSWQPIAVTYDGSSRASGMRIYVDGELVPTQVVRDNLTKQIQGGGEEGDHIIIGARYRDFGLAGSMVSEFRVFNSELSGLEVRSLAFEIPLVDLVSRYLEREPDHPRADFSNQLLREHFAMNCSPECQTLRKNLNDAVVQLAELEDSLTEIMTMRELSERRPSFFLERGLYYEPRQSVEPGTPVSLGDQPALEANDRMAFAQWLVQPDHPLTARVTVNRYWQMIFGDALVRTPEDFGSQGKTPTHPQLLDWLAVDFVENGWDVKRLIRQMVTSATYQQSSQVTAEMLELDPDNIYLSRAPAYRLPAEMIRDNALSVSGLMVDKIGGPPAKPYQVAASFAPAEPDKGEGLYRRSVYTYWKRTGPAPVLTALDAARRDICRVQRERTSSPLQSLVLLNDPQMIEASRALAERIIKGRPAAEMNARLSFLFRVLTSRQPTDDEHAVLATLYNKKLEYFTANEARAIEYLSVGEHPRDESLNSTEVAALASVANTMFSFD
ncbi:MAG: DUF1553 domain-containing protein, partial [Pirellulaceae bacterium]